MTNLRTNIETEKNDELLEISKCFKLMCLLAYIDYVSKKVFFLKLALVYKVCTKKKLGCHSQMIFKSSNAFTICLQF